MEYVDTEGNTRLSWEQMEVRGSSFVKFEADTEKVLTLTKWEMVEKEDRFTPGEQKLYFIAEVSEEDGEVMEKVLESPSARLRSKLAAVLKGKATQGDGGVYTPASPVKVSIMKTGDKFNTNYVCKLVGE